MPNVTIKGYQESITVDFGDLFAAVKTKRSRWRKDALIACFITDTDAVVIRTVYKQDFVFSHNGAAGTLRVDAVDDVQPMSPTHLFDLITSHIG